jgi:glycosyltransferase involved in cell wall biosynthesis
MRRLLRSRRNEVIYNGVDLELFSNRSPEAGARNAIRERCGFQPGDFVIGLSAVLRPEKNPVQLVEAVAALRRRDVPAKALFIGDGALRGAVEARARELGIAAHVLVSGFQQEVRPWIAACDALVLCSVTEAFSLAAIEAMALEKPVVHTDVGGAAEMIVPGWNGYLYPPGDTAALVQRLALLAEPEARLRLGRAAREVVEEFFSEQKMVSRYENTLIELSTKRGQPA